MTRAPLNGECRGVHPDWAAEAQARVSFALKCMEAEAGAEGADCIVNSHVVG